jgi:hypothetical protein
MNPFLILGIAALIILSLFFFASDKHLKTETALPSEMQGTFTLMLYGCRSADDIENMVLFDKEGDAFTFEIYSPEFSYTVKTNVPAGDALAEAEKFVRCNINCEGSQLRKILGPGGNSIGFELKPLYSPVLFGIRDVLDIGYVIKERKVTAYIKLDSNAEKTRRY